MLHSWQKFHTHHLYREFIRIKIYSDSSPAHRL